MKYSRKGVDTTGSPFGGKNNIDFHLWHKTEQTPDGLYIYFQNLTQI